MSKRTEKAAASLEAKAELKKLLKPGAEVWTILRHVSSSGMYRVIDLVIPYVRTDDVYVPDDVTPGFPADGYAKREGSPRAFQRASFGGVAPDGSVRLDYDKGESLHFPRADVQLIKHTRRPAIRSIGWLAAQAMGDSFDADKEGIKIGGAGMDMGFHLVYSLGRTLYPTGVKRGYAGRPERDGGYSFKHTWL